MNMPVWLAKNSSLQSQRVIEPQRVGAQHSAAASPSELLQEATSSDEAAKALTVGRILRCLMRSLFRRLWQCAYPLQELVGSHHAGPPPVSKKALFVPATHMRTSNAC